MRLEIHELTSDRDIASAFSLMRELRDRLRGETFLSEVRRQQVEGYRLYGALADRRLVSLAGVRRTHTLSRGGHLFVDDLVTSEDAQGKGYGRALLLWLADRAREEGLSRIYLDSRATAKGLYERLGFRFHTSIPCWIEIENLAALS
jgi:GNAT superfamily N-acetyltransferase